MKKKSFLTAALSLFMAATLSVSAIGCGGDDNPIDSLLPGGSTGGNTSIDSGNSGGSTGGNTSVDSSSSSSSSSSMAPIELDKNGEAGVYTLNEYTAQMPGQWCTILSSDSVDNDLESYLTSSFYEFNYEFNDDGSIVSGSYVVEYSAATALTDVTAKYAGQYGLAEDATSGQAFAMSLRHDLTWDDGTPIKAEDFVWTMQQQLSPNYLFSTAANYYSGNYIIHNAENYLKQGQKGWYSAATFIGSSIDSIEGLTFDATNVPAFKDIFGTTDMTKLSGYAGYFVSGGVNVYDTLVAYAGDNRTAMTQEIFNILKGLFAEDGGLNPDVSGWSWADDEIGYFTVVWNEYVAMDYSEVGFFVGDNEYELVIVIDNTLSPIKEDGSLSYEAGYYFSGWPLVKKSIWEACEDSSNGVPYSNSYATTLEKTASWGPYKLSNYQTDKTYTVSRNDKWFGYALDQYKGQYQVDRIKTSYIPEWDTAWMSFQGGALDAIGMNVKIVGDYRNTKRAYFTPSTATFDLNIQSIATSHEDGRNNLLLNYADFRKAISLAINRDDYCAKNAPSSQGALGYLNSMYYYDVENGKVYRESDQAKEALLIAYGATKLDEDTWKVGEHEFYDLDEALDAVTGYNLTLARQLVDQAVTAAIAAGDYVEGETVVLTFGTDTITTDTDRVKNWFQAAFDEMVKETKLEGKIRIDYFLYDSNTWADQFQDGEYDLCFGGWSNAAFNPAYLLCETQISDSNRWAVNWDPSTVNVTVTLKGDAEHEGGEFTYSLEEWRLNLQGMKGCKLDVTAYPIEDQLTGLAAVEAAILQEYYCIPVYSRTSASLMGYKVDYISYEYNTFMGYGGIRYMTFNYDDAEWVAYVKANNSELNYKVDKD